jgi:hypothetical protein
LPAFFFPPLAFFAIVSYPPLHVGVFARAPTTSPGGCRLARAPEIAAPRIGPWRDRLGKAPSSIEVDELDELHKGWPELAALIPDVDYGSYHGGVKHNRPEKVKKMFAGDHMLVLSCCFSA